MKLLLPGIPYKIKHYHTEEDNNTMESHLDQIKKGDNHEYDNWSGIKNEYSDKIINMISEKYIPNLKSILKKKIVYHR